MMKKSPKSSSENLQQRAKYVDRSTQFSNWVHKVGLEKTFFGRILLHFETHLDAQRIFFLFVFCLTLSLLISYKIDFSVDLLEGEIAHRDIKSPIAFEIVDESATESKRAEVEKSIPPIFDFDPTGYDKIVNQIYQSFRLMRTKVRQIEWPKDLRKREELIKDFLSNKPEFETSLSRPIDNRLFEWLTEQEFSAQIENLLIRILESWSSEKIVDSLNQSVPVGQDQVLIRMFGRKGETKEEYTVEKTLLKETSDANAFPVDQIRNLEYLSKKDRGHLLKLARMVMIPNVTFNMRETAERRQKARDSVLPIVISVKKNQIIITQGSVVQPIHVTFLREIEKVQTDKRHDLTTIMITFLFMTILLAAFSYLKRFAHRKVLIENKDISVMGVILIFVVVVTKIFLFFTRTTFLSEIGATIPQEVFLFAAPVASGPMLVGLLISSGEIIWIYTLFSAVTLSFMADMNFPFFIVTAIGGIVAARSIHGYKKRNDIYWSGLHTGWVNALGIAFLYGAYAPREIDLLPFLLWVVPAGCISGILSSLIAMMTAPLLESLFNYTTDIKLLELSNLNHPLLKEMIVQAPGTYHHSLVVGNMVEGAAEKIGANPLLAKVMSYYHDIGKIAHSNYFIENQRSGNNPHDHLSPNMSKTILIAHVKDGVELGMKYKLGKPIIDGILQHHGTTLISFFYNKAIENGATVAEEDFRYPGPKPQFREAALCMLADSIEAAARSLDEPTPLRLRNIVRNIIQRKFMDGQLDECNLTLRDLSIIESAFIYVLIGIYHQRIDYPKKAGGGVSESAAPIAKIKPPPNGGGGTASA